MCYRLLTIIVLTLRRLTTLQTVLHPALLLDLLPELLLCYQIRVAFFNKALFVFFASQMFEVDNYLIQVVKRTF
jgi:hypothetical protein